MGYIYIEFQNIENDVENSNKYYEYIDDFIMMLNDKHSHIRLRGFKLICRLSKYDIQNKIEENIELLLSVLDDDRPTIVRQCLSDIELLFAIPKLIGKIEYKLKHLDLSKYKDTMKPLIESDIERVIGKI